MQNPKGQTRIDVRERVKMKRESRSAEVTVLFRLGVFIPSGAEKPLKNRLRHKIKNKSKRRVHNFASGGRFNLWPLNPKELVEFWMPETFVRLASNKGREYIIATQGAVIAKSTKLIKSTLHRELATTFCLSRAITCNFR